VARKISGENIDEVNVTIESIKRRRRRAVLAVAAWYLQSGKSYRVEIIRTSDHDLDVFYDGHPHLSARICLDNPNRKDVQWSLAPRHELWIRLYRGQPKIYIPCQEKR
jgi:hypothetical protein